MLGLPISPSLVNYKALGAPKLIYFSKNFVANVQKSIKFGLIQAALGFKDRITGWEVIGCFTLVISILVPFYVPCLFYSPRIIPKILSFL